MSFWYLIVFKRVLIVVGIRLVKVLLLMRYNAFGRIMLVTVFGIIFNFQYDDISG